MERFWMLAGRRLASAALVALALLIASSPPPPTSAQEPAAAAQLSSELPQQALEAIDAIVMRVGQERRAIAGILERHGFPPPAWAEERWRALGSMPIAEQLETAWRAAEAYEAGSGEKLIETVAVDYSQINPALALDMNLPARSSEPGTFGYARLPTGAAPASLPAAVGFLIDRIAEYAEGRAVVHMVRCCGITERNARNAVLSAENSRDALAHAIATGTMPPELARRIALLIESVTIRNTSLAFDPGLADLRSELLALAVAQQSPMAGEMTITPDERAVDALAVRLDELIAAELSLAMAETGAVPEQMRYGAAVARLSLEGGRRQAEAAPGVPPADGPAALLGEPIPGGGGGGGGGGAFVAARNAAFDVVDTLGRSPPGGRRTFEWAVSTGAGRGGVVLGDRVTASSELPRVESVSWQALDGEPGAPGAQGVFRLLLADGRVVFSPPLEAADARAAVRLIFTGYGPDVPAIAEGDEIGLAGLDYHFEVATAEDGPFRSGVRASVNRPGTAYVIHPAIADAPIGRSAALVDGLLMSKARPVLEGLLQRVDMEIADFSSNIPSFRTYKFTDHGLRIELLGQIVRAVSDVSPEGMAADAAPRLTLRLYGEVLEPIDSPPARTAQTLSTLRDVSADVARLDRFAETLGILRWARAQGAPWLDEIGATHRLVPRTATLLRQRNGEFYFELLASPEAHALLIAHRHSDAALRRLREAQAPLALINLEQRTAIVRERLVALAAADRLFDAMGTAAREAAPPSLAEGFLARYLNARSRLLLQQHAAMLSATSLAHGAAIPGSVDWHDRHRSYMRACPNGVCIVR